MNLLYLTRVDIGSSAAQARQIYNMGRAFNEELGEGFMLMSGSSTKNDCPFAHRSIPFAEFTQLRYLGACLVAAKRTIKRKDDAVFTRDIMVAAVVVLFGGHAIYEAHKDPQSKLAHYMMKMLAKVKRFCLVSVSETLSQYYKKRYSIPDSRRLTAHSAVFLEDYEQLRSHSKASLRKELCLPINKLIIVHTGSLYKGGAEMFGKLVDDLKDVIFVHVGASLKECYNWEKYYKVKGIGNVFFIPHQSVENVRKYQVSADLLFYVNTSKNPIHWCTSPLKLFEYMASGTPILASRLGSVAEVVDSDVAFIYSHNNESSLRQQLKQFINDRADGLLRANKALELVGTRHTWSLRAKVILEKFTVVV